jgi:hypothetical protein
MRLLRSETTSVQYNVAHSSLEDKSKTYLSPLLMMLGLKKSVKSMAKVSERFAYLRKNVLRK